MGVKTLSIRLACKVTKVLLMGREQTQKKPDKKEKKNLASTKVRMAERRVPQSVCHLD